MTRKRKQEKKPELDPDSFEDRFHWLLGRLVRAISALDFNLGLQLRWIAQYAQQDVSKHLRTPNSKLGDRLNALQELVPTVFASAGEPALDEFRDWFAEATVARGLRNAYAHGRWATPGALQKDAEGRALNGKFLLAFVPIDFDMTPGRPDTAVHMTLEAFEKDVIQAERLFSKFWNLTERYGMYVRTPT